MQKYAICNKTSKYAKLCNTRFGFWGPRDLIRKEPEFEAPIAPSKYIECHALRNAFSLSLSLCLGLNERLGLG
jgi:hypothetical protein